MKTTELDAINMCLASIGEMPVKDASVQIPEVALAKGVIQRVIREVLSKNWHFNSDTDYKLTPDAGGFVKLPHNALKVDPTDDRQDVVVRGGFLYDRTNKTKVFAQPVKVDVSWYLPFGDLPEPAAAYVAIRASRIFQRERLGSNALDAMSAEAEMSAYIALEDFDNGGADYNILNNNAEIAQARTRSYL